MCLSSVVDDQFTINKKKVHLAQHHKLVSYFFTQTREPKITYQQRRISYCYGDFCFLLRLFFQLDIGKEISPQLPVQLLPLKEKNQKHHLTGKLMHPFFVSLMRKHFYLVFLEIERDVLQYV